MVKANSCKCSIVPVLLLAISRTSSDPGLLLFILTPFFFLILYLPHNSAITSFLGRTRRMSFFSRKKNQQQPPAQPPATVTVNQTPSQALAQLSNGSRDLNPPQQQSASLRGDGVLAS